MEKGFTFQNFFSCLESLAKCCSNPERETIDHLFYNGEVAKSIWSYVNRGSTNGNVRLKEVILVVPMIILWFLWKRRNTILHGGFFFLMLRLLEMSLLLFVNLLCPDLRSDGTAIGQMLEQFRNAWNIVKIRGLLISSLNHIPWPWCRY
ncbi:hypothetical protein H5410_045444 [Solanum commersonii]|uniref:Uncharacterized protein n=1 Tax=Solanum commersonii TaxID=4109 RepID=A0A9J5XB54_SOLCO|nr:hypothetical protein H5410_045444 [Solanum commersonii]